RGSDDSWVSISPGGTTTLGGTGALGGGGLQGWARALGAGAAGSGGGGPGGGARPPAPRFWRFSPSLGGFRVGLAISTGAGAGGASCAGSLRPSVSGGACGPACSCPSV